jgi:type IV pilus assembly protein PilE
MATHASLRSGAQPQGFTLIELLVVIVVVAILAAVAVPAYTDQIRKSRRADAQNDIMQVAQGLHRHFTVQNQFTGGPCPDSNTFYDIACTLGAASFTVQATPTAGGPQVGDRCGVLGIDHADRRTVASATLTAAECW